MDDEDLEIVWLPEAQELLARRDRFTRLTIQKDFSANPMKDSVTLDVAKGLFATPVANNRYAVIWSGATGGKAVVQVKAVVASQYRGESAVQLKNKLEQVVAFETNGLVKSF